MKYRTKVATAVEHKPRKSSIPGSFQRGGCRVFLRLSLPVYISVGFLQYLHNILFVYTQSDKSGNLQTVYFVNYSRCIAYLCI